MKKDEANPENDELRPEYDLSALKGGIRGKYLERYRAGTNLALLAPEVPGRDTVRGCGRILCEIQES